MEKQMEHRISTLPKWAQKLVREMEAQIVDLEIANRGLGQTRDNLSVTVQKQMRLIDQLKLTAAE